MLLNPIFERILSNKFFFVNNMDLSTRPIMVSIQCWAYNHESYIRQCLEGFVMQKTNFRFEAIVHDDASTDGTAVIIREYAEKYPDIIKPIYETENQYSKHDGSLGRIMDAEMRGKYIAMCEGDDYWTDPYKLQKQVDFLERHPDYSMCFHAADVLMEGVDVAKKGAQCEDLEEREYNSTEMFSSWIVPTASIVYRASKVNAFQIKHPEWLTRGDISLVLKCSHTGRVWGMSKRMSVYRMQPNSVSHNPLYRGKEYIKLPNHFRCIFINYPKVDKAPVRWCISRAYYSRMKLGKGLLNKVRDFFLFIVWDPRGAFRKIYELITRK